MEALRGKAPMRGGTGGGGGLVTVFGSEAGQWVERGGIVRHGLGRRRRGEALVHAWGVSSAPRGSRAAVMGLKHGAPANCHLSYCRTYAVLSH